MSSTSCTSVSTVEVGEAAEGAEACVVDQEVDGVLGVGEPVLDGRETAGGEQVGGEHVDRHAVCSGELGAQFLEPRLVAGDEHEVVSSRRERDREGAADARRRARDQRDTHERSSALATVVAVASTGSPTCTSAMARLGSLSP